MKQTLTFLQKFYLQFTGVFAFFGIVLLGGCWLTRTQEYSNLFYVYLGMYSFFFVVFPMVIALSMRYYLELCISFGATRKSIFACLQLLTHALFLTFLLLSIGLELACNALLPADKISQMISLLAPSTLLLSCLVSLLLLQGGVCMGRIKMSKLGGVIMGVAFGLMGAFFGAGAAMSAEIYIPVLDAASPWYWGLCGAMLLGTVGLFTLSRRMYRVAVVTV